MSAGWCRYRPAEARLTLSIHARPGAKTSDAAGLHGDALKVHIAAPAVDDKANAELLRWLAAALDLPRSALRLKTGATGRRKIIEIHPIDAATAARAAALAD